MTIELKPIMFVSLGPGEPELITLKGLKALQQADFIFCPCTTMANGSTSSRAKNILLELGIEESKINLFDVPMNKDRTKAIANYKEVSFDIAKHYSNGSKIVVTAEGDAGFYSSIYYISENLEAMYIPTKRIAGIPAFLACSTLANLHIVKQEEELVVIPGVTTTSDLDKNLADRRSIVVMKPSQCESSIKELLATNSVFDCHYFENVGVDGKEFYTTDRNEIIARKFPYFSLIIIRK